MTTNLSWKLHALGACTTLLLGACAVDSADDSADSPEDEAAQSEAITTGGCTAVKLTAPAAGFQVGAGFPMTLTATATCTGTPEFQYWAKPGGAANWSILGDYQAGSKTWSPPWVGTWSLSAVVRTQGSLTGKYEARSAAVSGTAIHLNRNPTPVDDDITTTENVPGSVDVLANDSDPDGETVSLTGHGDPAHGAVVFVGSMATYTPTHGYVGSDSFTYAVSDGVGGSATGTVNITIADQAPTANADTLMTRSNVAGTVNVLTNDTDPDGDDLTVTEFTQGGHGSVAFAGAIATYTPAAGYVGSDSFTYTIDDGHAMTATGTVNVTVSNPLPGCQISISGPASGVYGQNLHLVAAAMCNTGAAQVQWFHRIGSTYVNVGAWSSTLTLDYTADLVGGNLFYAQVRTQGTTKSQGTSNTLSVPVADNTPQCTTLRVTAPTSGATLHVGLAQALTATATCPAGSTAEYQFWVKPSTTSTWTVLPGYTAGSSSWTPAATGSWAVKAVVRTVGSHVAYQIGSPSVAVTVAP